MTTLREAAQQALDDLRDLHANHNITYAGTISRLEAALAEPVQEPEPAGWFEGPFGEFRANPLHRIAWPAQTVAWSIPLYLAPPQRKPLTEEQIKACEKQAMVDGALPHEQRLLFARAIERAHGIV